MKFYNEELNNSIEKKIIGDLKYIRKIDPNTFEQYYEKTVSFVKHIEENFNEEDYDYIFDYLKEKEVIVQGECHTLLSNYDNYKTIRVRKDLADEELEQSPTREENNELLEKYNSTSDLKIKKEICQEIALKNLRFLYMIANSISNSIGIDKRELLGAGYEGLVFAIKNYKMIGTSFAEYMKKSITGFILTSISEYYSFEKRSVYGEITKYKRELEKDNIQKIESFQDVYDELLDKCIKDDFRKNDYNVIEILSYNIPKYFSSCEDEVGIEDEIEMKTEKMFREKLTDDIREELSKLPDDYQKMIDQLYGFTTGEALPLRTVAKDHNVSHQTIAQRNNKIIKKLKNSKVIKSYKNNIG